MNDFPKLGQPARRALANEGITQLKDLTKITITDTKKWHGFGPASIKVLKQALAEKGMNFKKEA